MKNTLTVVLSTLLISGTLADITLKETGGGVKKPGDTTRLTCQVSGFSLSSYGVNWVRQPPGQGIQWVGYMSSGGGTALSPSIKDRTSISRDVPKGEVFLDISKMKTEDTGTYYCARAGGLGLDAWGKGTFVTVTSATPSGPFVYPVSPCCNAQKSQDPLKIGCFVTADSPSGNIQWFQGTSEITVGVTQYPDVYSNGRYSLSSALNLKSDDWKAKSYKCRFGEQNKQVEKRDCGCPTKPPTMQLYMSSCDPDDVSTNVYLTCELSNFAPKDIEVAWFKNSQTVTNFITVGRLTEVDKCSFHTFSKLKITREEWDQGAEYKCLVTHSEKTSEKNISSCTEK